MAGGYQTSAWQSLAAVLLEHTLGIVCRDNLIQDLDVLGELRQQLLEGTPGLWLLSHVKCGTPGSSEAHLSRLGSLGSGLGRPNIPGQLGV